jgi:hypothetical protein
MVEPKRTRRFVALAHDFDCVTADSALYARIERVLDSLASDGRATTTYTLVGGQERPPRSRFLLEYQGAPVATCATREALVEMLLWHVNRSAVTSSPEYLLLHAGVVSWDGRAALLPGPTGSGKTTLVAGLVAAGLSYLSDEVAAIDPATKLVHSFPKALTLKEGSRVLLPHLEPPTSGSGAGARSGQWQVDPRSIRAGCVARLAAIHLVVFPRFEAGGPPRLTRLSPTEALLTMAQNAFNLRVHAKPGLEILRNIAETVPCYQLVMGDLTDACAYVTALLRDTPQLSPATATDNQTVVMGPDADAIHVLNEQAALVWSRFRAGSSIDEVVDELSANFDSDPHALRADVTAVLAELTDLGLIDGAKR